MAPPEGSSGCSDRFRGALLGLLTGECLGASLEGLSPGVIQRLHQHVTEIRGGGHLGLPAGQHAAATDTMLCVAESLASLRRLDIAEIIARWLEWRRTAPRRIDATTTEALDKIESGTPWRDAGRKVTQANTAGNGTMSRVVPLALFLVHDRGALVRHAVEITAATHAHPEAVGASVALAVLVAELANGATVVEAIEVAAAMARSRQESMVAASIRGSDRKELRDLHSTSYSLHTLEIASWCLVRCETLEESLIAATNLGGDASTTGAITGALTGARHGASAIPARWTSVVRAHDRVRDLADRLLALSA